jgi:hypothetical protein
MRPILSEAAKGKDEEAPRQSWAKKSAGITGAAFVLVFELSGFHIMRDAPA